MEPGEFRCIIPQCNENPNNATVLDFNETIFAKDDDEIDYCRRYPVFQNVSGQCTEKDFDFNSTDMVLCDPHRDNQQIVYGEFGMDTTVVTEFNLICGDQYKV